MIKRILLFLIILAVTSTFISAAYSQTKKKTVKLPTGEVVCDLSGEWNVLYSHYGEMAWVGEIRSVLKITLQGHSFNAITLKATEWSPAGTEKLQGELDKNGIKKAKYFRPHEGWVDAKGILSKDCKKIVFDDGKGVKVILDRK